MKSTFASKDPAQLTPLAPTTKGQKLKQHFRAYYWLYLFMVPTLIWFAIFCYAPMAGIWVAFTRNPKGAIDIWEAPVVGFKWFQQFFKSPFAMEVIRNTLVLSFYSLLTFPLPVIFALMINEVRNAKFKNTIQTILYAPHFISTVVLVSMINIFFDGSGIVNNALAALTGNKTNFLTNPDIFPHMYVWSFVWQNLGWNCIIYVAALSGVDPSLHEAATLDGASRLQKIWHVNIPTILPTIVITLIMRVGQVMVSNTDKVLLMQNDLNKETADVIGTYVYNMSLNGGSKANFAMATAIGLFSNLINLILLLTVNKVSKKVTETSLF